MTDTDATETDPRVHAAEERVRAERARAAAEGARKEADEAEKAASRSERKAGMGSSGGSGNRGAGGKGAGAKAAAGKAGSGIRRSWAASNALADKVSGALTKNANGAVKTTAKFGARAIPFVGSGVALVGAVQDFKSGDYVGGVINSLGVLLSPIPGAGWVAAGAATLWDLAGGGDPGMWDAPSGSDTHILPGSASKIDGVGDADAALTESQREWFSFEDGPQGSVWNQSPPEALRLDTPAVQSAASDWLGGVAAAFSNIGSTLQSSGEPYMQEYMARLQPHLDAMSALPATGKAMVKALTAASDSAGQAYSTWHDANAALRQQLSDSGELSDSSSVRTAETAADAAERAITDAATKIVQLAPTAAPALIASHATPRGVEVPDPAPAPAPAPAAPLTPAAPAPEEDSKGSIDELLSALRSGNPMSGGSPMGGGSPLGGLGGGTPMGGGTPLGGQGGKPLSPNEGRKLVDDDDEKTFGGKDDKARKLVDRDSLSASKPENATTAAPAAPAAASTTPSAAARAATPGTPAGAGDVPPVNKTVDVKGERVEFPDAKTAKLAQLLADADPTHPMSLAEAAKAAGLTPPVPGQDPGTQIAPANARPGDVLVAGDRQFMLLGDGRFYDLAEYKTIGASELPADLGSRAGFFRLGDAGDGALGGGPVSGPTEGAVPFDVPGGQPATGPVDASAPPPNTAVPPPGETGHPDADPGGSADAPPAPAPAGGIPSTGTPGVPDEGAEGGPANAAATDPGVGTPGVSTSGQSLDPAAVR